MAKPKDIGAALANGGELKPVATTIQTMLKRIDIQQRFKEMLGQKAAGFMSSILSVSNQNKLLKTADPITIISAASVAASLDLPINSSLGFAHIVPYRDNKSGRVIAQFQMGWKGFVQLAMRSGQYKTMAVGPVCEGELVSANPFTGEYVFSHDAKKSDKIIGYVAYFKLLNGFEKYYYMTDEQLEKHGKRYSKSYETGLWSKNNGEPMKMKTVIKQLLSKFGILSIAMEKAISSDQALIKEDGTPEYLDKPEDQELLPEHGEGAGEDGEGGKEPEPEIPFGEPAPEK